MQIDRSEIIELLGQTTLFGYLDAGRLNSLAALCNIKTFQAGELIFTVGDPSNEMYVICEGGVELSAFKKRSWTIFTTLHRGDLFGEEALLVDDPRYYQVIAVDDVVLVSLNVDNYLYLYEELPGIEDRLEVLVDSRELAIKTPVSWLGEEEYIQVIARRHPAILWRREIAPLVTGLAVMILSLLMLWLWLPGRPYGWLLLGLGVPIFLFWSIWTYFDWRNDYFLLTNKRVVWIEKVALIYDSRHEAPLRTIMSVGMQRSRLGMVFGFADVVVQTYVGTIRLSDLAHADTIASMIESYWHRADDRDRREEAELMDRKLSEKLEEPGYSSSTTQAGRTQSTPQPYPENEREPGFLEWLFSDFIRLRYEGNGAITYRKHWFVLVRAIWLPVLLMGLALVAFIGRLTGGLTFVPMTEALIALSALMFVLFLWILYQYADWRNDIFQVTLDQIVDIDRKPLGKVRRRSAPLENVLSIEYERRGFWGFLFNFGTVYISVGNSRLTFDFVYNPSEVQQDIFYRMGERLEQVRQFEIDSERERISEWIASYHRRTSGSPSNNPENQDPEENNSSTED
jgi:CRP-like cAMP-binding protein